MAYNAGTLDAALAAAVGRQSALAADLRIAFIESAVAHFNAMRGAATLADWRAHAERLHGLAASFGARRVMEVAGEALAADYVDAAVLRKIERAISSLNH